MCHFRHWPFYFVLISSTSYIYYYLEIDINFLVIPWGHCDQLPSRVPKFPHSSGWIYAFAHPILMNVIFPLVICSWHSPLVQILIKCQSGDYQFLIFKFFKKWSMLERKKKETDRHITVLFHSCTHSLIDYYTCPDLGSDLQPWHIGMMF